ncbi:hypothetical protein Vadar_011170 [Vaccinium darrowii]|uniref:Uncharacterized protein n=1 Tax=Vaccinium darrowii TaxID=229202 RepID=A0ACB7ZJK3_9ERIC|nr:hypothetical protein Vadar_011170 [Vaccinium darrowii]
MADFENLDLEKGSGVSEANNSVCLVGKVIHGKNIRAPVLLNILKVAWKTRAPFHIDDWNNNVFLFRFENGEDRKTVIQEGPWSVMNGPLVLIPLADGMIVSELKFNKCPFWVQIHGLPVEKMSRANAITIGNRLGSLLAVEAAPDGDCLSRGFLRIRVNINVEQPLPKGFWLKGKTVPSKDRWISFKFEKLPDFCYSCGRLGHDNKGCHFVSKEEGVKSGFEPELRTGRAHRCDTPVEFFTPKGEAVEETGKTLIVQQQEEQSPVTEARDRDGVPAYVVFPFRTTDLQEHDTVIVQNDCVRPGPAVLHGTGVNASSMTDVMPLQTLSILQGISPIPSPIMDQPIKLGLIEIPTGPSHRRQSTKAQFLGENQQYFVTEPPESPRGLVIPNLPALPQTHSGIPITLTQTQAQSHTITLFNPTHTESPENLLTPQPINPTPLLQLNPSTDSEPETLPNTIQSSSNPAPSPSIIVTSHSKRTLDITISSAFNSLSLKGRQIPLRNHNHALRSSGCVPLSHCTHPIP